MTNFSKLHFQTGLFICVLLAFAGFTDISLAATPNQTNDQDLMIEGGSFRTYPGILDPQAEVEMITDKGLTKEIVLRCDIMGGRKTAGIMIFSKIEKLFCSSKNRCYADIDIAASETCGW